MVAEYLRAEEESAWSEARIPDAGRIWWKGQLLARRAAARQAVRPIVVVERFALASASLAVVGVASWQWPRLHRATVHLWTALRPATLSLVRSLPAGPNTVWPLAGAATAAALAMALGAYFFIYADD